MFRTLLSLQICYSGRPCFSVIRIVIVLVSHVYVRIPVNHLTSMALLDVGFGVSEVIIFRESSTLLDIVGALTVLKLLCAVCISSNL